MNESIKLDLTIAVSMSFSNKLMLKDWNCKTLNTDVLNLDGTSSSTRIIFEGEGSPRYSHPKHARHGKNEESSRTTN